MSLIFQALQRTGQHISVEASAGQLGATATKTPQSHALLRAWLRLRGSLLMGMAVGAVIVLAMVVGKPLLPSQAQAHSQPQPTLQPQAKEANQVLDVVAWSAAATAAASQTATKLPEPSPPALAPLPKAVAVVDTQATGTLLQPQLPTAVQASAGLPPHEGGRHAASLQAAAPLAASAHAVLAANVQPVIHINESSAPAGVVKVTTTTDEQRDKAAAKGTARAPDKTPAKSSEADLAGHFQALNRALAQRDEATAEQHLKAIQATLPPASIARMRAEAWAWFQTGQLDQANDAYQLLLKKIPGDENAALNLVSLQLQQNQPGNARKTLLRALELSPSSVNLRRALQQLGHTEAGQ